MGKVTVTPGWRGGGQGVAGSPRPQGRSLGGQRVTVTPGWPRVTGWLTESVSTPSTGRRVEGSTSTASGVRRHPRGLAGSSIERGVSHEPVAGGRLPPTRPAREKEVVAVAGDRSPCPCFVHGQAPPATHLIARLEATPSNHAHDPARPRPQPERMSSASIARKAGIDCSYYYHIFPIALLELLCYTRTIKFMRRSGELPVCGTDTGHHPVTEETIRT